MRFIQTALAGAYIIEPEKLADERGFFARTWCQREFEEHGLKSKIVQCNISSNKQKGTLRGMHFQAEPHAEAKVVCCTKGAIYDVIIDLRPGSETFKRHLGVYLTGSDMRMLYVPEGFAHGFQTLEDNSEVMYQMTEFYHAESARGVRWDDSLFGIDWPYKGQFTISDRDRTWPDYQPVISAR